MNDDHWMTKVSVLQTSTCCCCCCSCLAVLLLPFLSFCFNHRYHHYCFCLSLDSSFLLDSSSNFQRRSKLKWTIWEESIKIAFELAMRASMMQMNRRPPANWTAASLCLALDFLPTSHLLRAATTRLTKTLMPHSSTFAYTFNFTQPAAGHREAEFRYLMLLLLLLLYNQRTRDGPVFDHHFVTTQHRDNNGGKARWSDREMEKLR